MIKKVFDNNDYNKNKLLYKLKKDNDKNGI